MKKPLLTTLGLTALITVISASMISLDNSNREWHKKTETEFTQAKITSIDLGDHDSIYFDYVVKGKVYHSGTRGIQEAKPGDSIILYYNPLDPTQVTLGEHRPLALFSEVWGMAIISLAVLWTYYLIFDKPKRNSSKPARFSR